MTEEELAAIEERRAYWDGRAACDDCACMDDIPALVAEVRRLRVEVERGRLRAVRDECVVALRALNSAVWLDHPRWAIVRAETACASEVIARHGRENMP